jgi:hypothetical protein
MRYDGFNEEFLFEGYTELKDLGLPSFEIYPILHLAGAKWRSVQFQQQKHDDVYDGQISAILSHLTKLFLNMTMVENYELSKLLHTEDFTRCMLLSIGISFGQIAKRNSPIIGPWLRSGDIRRRRSTLAFAIGSSIIVEDGAIDGMMSQIVESRYVMMPETEKKVADSIVAFIERLGNAGSECLNPVADAR